jgi:copper homeostasis protein CutC
MSSDIEAFSAEGVQGFVFGCLNDQGGLDEEAMKQYVFLSVLGRFSLII